MKKVIFILFLFLLAFGVYFLNFNSELNKASDIIVFPLPQEELSQKHLIKVEYSLRLKDYNNAKGNYVYLKQASNIFSEEIIEKHGVDFHNVERGKQKDFELLPGNYVLIVTNPDNEVVHRHDIYLGENNTLDINLHVKDIDPGFVIKSCIIDEVFDDLECHTLKEYYF